MARRSNTGSGRILAELKQRIINGVYPPHSYLPAERLLSENFDAGRAVVRKALASLEAEGFVERTHGRGTKVLSNAGRGERPKIAVVHSHWRGWSSTEPFLLFDGIRETLDRLGYDFERVNFSGRPSLCSEEDGVVVLPSQVLSLADRYDGIVLHECYEEEISDMVQALEARRYPVVVANMEFDLPVTATRVDHAAVMEAAVGVLIGFGHTRIGLYGLAPEWYFYGAAIRGFQRGMERAGLKVDDELILAVQPDGQRDPALTTQVSQWLRDLPQRPTAIIAARDLFAQGVCAAIEEMGLTVGRDISVIGYDDVSWPLRDPFLTTFREPCYDLGRVAVEMLHERILHGWRPVEQRMLDAPLILRRSVGPVVETSQGAMSMRNSQR